jgi:hypothetical protein
MAGERFPLPVDIKTLRVKLVAYVPVTQQEDPKLFTNREYQEYTVEQLPIQEAAQRLYRVGPVFNEPDVSLVVTYSVN